MSDWAERWAIGLKRMRSGKHRTSSGHFIPDRIAFVLLWAWLSGQLDPIELYEMLGWIGYRSEKAVELMFRAKVLWRKAGR